MFDHFLASIGREPSLADWITSLDWSDDFESQAIHRATIYANRQSIRIHRSQHEYGKSILCEASVTGGTGKHNHTILDFYIMDGEWGVETSCSCREGFDCPHTTALFLLLAKELGSTARPALRTVPDSITPQVSSWLGQLASAKPTTPQEPARPSAKFFAYCLHQQQEYSNDETSWHIGLRNASWKKNGAPSIGRATPYLDLSHADVLERLRPEDTLAITRYFQLRRKRGRWADPQIEGPDAREALDAIVATGRCFILSPDNKTWTPIRYGPPVHVKASWRKFDNDYSVPIFEFSDGIEREFLPTEPPLCFSPVTGELNSISSNIPEHLLNFWNDAPVVPTQHLPKISEQLQRISPALPTPHEIETFTLPAATPTPRLSIHKKILHEGWTSRDFIFANLDFRYSGGPLLPPLATGEEPVHIDFRDGKRQLQPRDPAAEQTAASHLLGLQLMPGHRLLPIISALPPLAWVHATSPSPDAWLEVIGSPEFAALKQDGWEIHIEPSTGLLFQDAGAFFSDIESETDHGIDWFRFDAKFDLDGREISLIPIIAQAIQRGLPAADSPDLPTHFFFPHEDPAIGSLRFPARRLMEMVDQVRHLFTGHHGDGPIRVDRLGAAGLANSLGLDSSETLRSLAALGRSLKDIRELPQEDIPESVNATLRPYQHEGFRWLRFLAKHGLHGILADDMGLGKTLQTLTHLAAEHAANPGKPSLVVAPTSVVPNWTAEAAKFTPHLKVLTLHGAERLADFENIPAADLVITSYPLLHRDIGDLAKHPWHSVILDEAQHIKNPKSVTAQAACALESSHRICLSGTPMENHLGELWSLMRFLMPGYLPDEKTFNSAIRKPIERDRSGDAQLALNRRVSPLILRRTKDQVATDLPPKTELIHHIDLTKKQVDLYESVRATMDKRVRDAIAAKGLAKSHIIVLDALLKLRQICCHPQLLKTPAAQKVTESAKLHFLTDELLPQLLEEGRRILLFSQFTSMLALIEAHLEKHSIPFLKLTGQTKDRATLVHQFQSGEVPIFLISLKAGGTGLNLTAADTVIHYDPWWNPAAENQATDRAHRIGQNKPVFVHKLVCRGSIEDRILDLQKHKSALVKALLSEETTSLRIDPDTLSHLLAPIV